MLQAMAFCVVYMGLFPRFAPENADNAAARLDRIVELVRGSKYGIHDLSRCRAFAAGDLARMNMPFELGIDHACRLFGEGELSNKSILVLEEQQYDYQRIISDISGWDIRNHQGEYGRVIRHVRSWLINQAHVPAIGASRIEGKYLEFQEWYWKREQEAGSSEDDIREYPTAEVVNAMHAWKAGEEAA